MGQTKSQNLQQLAHTLSIIGVDKETLLNNKDLPFATLELKNASDRKVEISINSELQDILISVINNYYERQEKLTFEKMRKLLK